MNEVLKNFKEILNLFYANTLVVEDNSKVKNLGFNVLSIVKTLVVLIVNTVRN